ncbi:hypothetical protein SpiGrapes_2461 [Sphaerochaeta pleomorpha str. Grapes]|uniref:Uncharacterized protein n=1 Tax=Sphaerochaeta pleomorpha (strain ATCC BAA-1885 / DSM 22778 / Grapes) TaxID=158190 RepID=G8QTI3_SPHPG|nr:hypothetical protein [Sphaerochaeta pleomorpha]AEV30224.1 hypothetical protein SpiGrapes_2461 [Sphaerochaeta pleomorpha str. Grapes]
MSNSELLLFFSGTYEKSLNGKMLYRNYKLPEDEVISYIDRISNYPFLDFLDIINGYNDVSYLTYDDVFQFSSFEDATCNICKVIKNAGDEGYSCIEIGKMLENDGKQRKDGAYTKYGENHAKTACQLGLLHSMSNVYFLTCIGACVNDLPIDISEKFISRICLRNNLIKKIIRRIHTAGQASYFSEVDFLCQSTAERRSSNVKTVIRYIATHADTEGFFEALSFQK